MDYNHRLTIDDETRAERIERAAVELRDAAQRFYNLVRSLEIHPSVALKAAHDAAREEMHDAISRFDAARRGET